VGAWTLLQNAQGAALTRPLDTPLCRWEISREKRREVTPNDSVGSASPREKRQGPASFPGASLSPTYRDSPKASLVPLTCLRVSSPLSSYNRPSPAQRLSTGPGIVVCTPSKGQSYGFGNGWLVGGPVPNSSDRGRGELSRALTHQIPLPPQKTDTCPISMQHNSCGIDITRGLPAKSPIFQYCPDLARAHPWEREVQNPFSKERAEIRVGLCITAGGRRAYPEEHIL
jgi:hypothetical protein